MDVDFAAPLGYVEPQYKKNPQNDSQQSDSIIKYAPKKEVKIGGEGRRLDGKSIKPDQISSKQNSTVTNSKEQQHKSTTDNNQNREEQPRGIPNYDYKIGTLNFNRNLTKKEVKLFEREVAIDILFILFFLILISKGTTRKR